MKRKILLILAISLSSAALYAQSGNVGIGTTTPHANALLELNSNSKGLLPPRLTTAQRDAITPKPEGLVIYNLDTHCLEYWNATQWISDCTSPITPSVVTLNCAGASIAPNTVTAGSAYTGTLTVPYTGGNGGSYSAGSPIASTGVAGLTATLQAGTLANGAGNLTYAVTGTPGSSGTATFPISFNGATSCNANVTVNAAPPPTPDLTATCTGAYLPSTVVNGGNATVTVNSVPVTASFSAYSFIENNGSGISQCGVLVDTYYGFGTVNNVAASMKINFSTDVTNLKLYLAYFNGGETLTFVLKNNGAIVSPTYTLSPVGTCNGNFTINSASNNISANGAPVSGVYYNAILNIGGVWFDEITLSSSNPFGGVGVRYCVGNAQ